MLEALLVGEIFGFLLVFTRVGATVMVMPGIGDGYVSPNIRLMLALLISLVAFPLLADQLPSLPANPLVLGALLVSEALIGVFLGYLARLLLTALDIAGMIIAFNTGLAAAQALNPALGQQGNLVGALLGTLGVLLILLTDMHHMIIMAVVDSYTLWMPGTWLPIGDAADMMSRLVAKSFLIGLQLAMPVLLVGIILNLGMGLLARLMPQIQVFFLILPIQIILGMLIMAITLSAMMLMWLGYFEESLVGFLRPS